MVWPISYPIALFFRRWILFCSGLGWEQLLLLWGSPCTAWPLSSTGHWIGEQSRQSITVVGASMYGIASVLDGSLKRWGVHHSCGSLHARNSLCPSLVPGEVSTEQSTTVLLWEPPCTEWSLSSIGRWRGEQSTTLVGASMYGVVSVLHWSLERWAVHHSCGSLHVQSGLCPSLVPGEVSSPLPYSCGSLRVRNSLSPLLVTGKVSSPSLLWEPPCTEGSLSSTSH